MNQEKLITTRLKSIDILRGIGALTIVLFHARPMFWVGIGEIWNRYGLSFNPNALLGYATTLLVFGGFAVDLFFVLSGYQPQKRSRSWQLTIERERKTFNYI